MIQWPYSVKPFSLEEIMKYIVDPEWVALVQKIECNRFSTSKVLDILEVKMSYAILFNDTPTFRKHEVQIDSYILTLRSRGQLSERFMVVKCPIT